MVSAPAVREHLLCLLRPGASQLVIGTDHPIPWNLHAVDHVLGTPGLSDEERIAILGGTAAKLLKIK